MENPREIVLDALLETEREELSSSRLIAGVLDKYDYLEQREKAFLKRLYEGCVESRITLDFYLDAVASVPCRRMKPVIRSILRMGAYQLLFLSGAADYAVVTESVSLARRRGFSKLTGFVNGVLRNLIRKRDAGELNPPDAEKAPAESLSVRYSVPEWIARMWMERYGAERTEDILKHLSAVHPVSLHFAETLSDAETASAVRNMEAMGAALRQSPADGRIYLAEHLPGVASLPGYEEGAFYVQDASSALAVRAAGIRPGDFVLDACASPGGKSLLAAYLTGPGGRVLARDLTAEKVSRIRENAARCHAGNLTAEVFDARISDPALAGRADVLLLDVPCSGLGVLGKKRDIKYRMTPEQILSLAALQREILTACVPYVRPGGTLLYSTCTISEAENEEQVRFLTEQFPLELVSLPVQILPDERGMDGFFYAVLGKMRE